MDSFSAIFQSAAAPQLMERFAGQVYFRPDDGDPDVPLAAIIGKETVEEALSAEGRDEKRTRVLKFLRAELVAAAGWPERAGCFVLFAAGAETGTTYSPDRLEGDSGVFVEIRCMRIGSIERSRMRLRRD